MSSKEDNEVEIAFLVSTKKEAKHSNNIGINIQLRFLFQ